VFALGVALIVTLFEKVCVPVHVGEIACDSAGAPSLRRNVVADPFTAESPTLAVGFAPTGAAAGVCHVAAVLDVAVSTWPLVGAVADEVLTVVVADLIALDELIFPTIVFEKVCVPVHVGEIP
jgi:hypothetical protein